MPLNVGVYTCARKYAARRGRIFTHFLAKVGKDVIEGEVTLGFEDSLAGMTS
jgi:hypothetical protein